MIPLVDGHGFGCKVAEIWGGRWWGLGSVLGTQVSISLQKHEASKLLFLLPPDSAKGWLSHAASQHDQSPGKGQAFLQE